MSTPIPRLQAPRAVLWLLGAYLVLSWATVTLIVILSSTAPGLVTPQAWFRGVIVAAISILTFVLARKAAKGRPRALLRLRIVVTIILVAIVAVVFFLDLPTWMVYQQILCGALLLAVAILVFGKSRTKPTTDSTDREDLR
jgi:FtsH-binding integral membrane protein